MCENVIIIGAGGHAKVIADIIIKSGDTLLGFLDDKKVGQNLLGFPVLDSIHNIMQFEDKAVFIVGIGDNYIRKKLVSNYRLHWYTAIHPSAQIGLAVEIGRGTAVMANAVINSCGKIGEHCIINTGSIIEHDDIIENYVHISPNATVCGTATIGSLTSIGAGATVKNNIKISNDCIIGAGAVVVKDMPAGCIAVGIPAKPK